MKRSLGVFVAFGVVAGSPVLAQTAAPAAAGAPVGSPSPVVTADPGAVDSGAAAAPADPAAAAQPLPQQPIDTRTDAPPPGSTDAFAPLPPAYDVQAGSLVPQPMLPQAQPGLGENAIETLLLPLSATRALLGFKIDAYFATEYNSNMLQLGDFFIQQQEAAGLNPHPEDWRFSPTIAINAGHDFGRQQVFLRSSLGYNWYKYNDYLNRQNILVNGGLNSQIGSSCTLGAQGSYTSGQNNLGNQPLPVANVVNSTSWGVDGQCGAAVGLSPFASINGFYQRNNSSSSALNRAAFDQNALTYSGGLSYRSPALGTFTVSASYTNTEYPKRQFVLPNGQVLLGVNNDSWNVGFSYSRQVGTRLNATAGLSYITSTTNSPGVAPFGGLGYNLSLTYTPTTRLTTSLYGNRSVNTQNNAYSNSTIATSFGGDVRYSLGTNISLTFAGSIVGDEYRGFLQSLAPPGSLIRKSQTIYYLNLGATYDFRQNLSFAIAGIWRRRDSDPFEYNYTGKGVRFSITGSF